LPFYVESGVPSPPNSDGTLMEQQLMTSSSTEHPWNGG